MVHGCSRAKIFVPEPINYPHQRESSGDDHKPLVGIRRPRVGNVHVLAPLEHSLVDAVQADGVWVGLPGDLVKLGRQMVHPWHIPPNLVDVTDVGDPPNAKVS